MRFEAPIRADEAEESFVDRFFAGRFIPQLFGVVSIAPEHRAGRADFHEVVQHLIDVCSEVFFRSHKLRTVLAVGRPLPNFGGFAGGLGATAEFFREGGFAAQRAGQGAHAGDEPGIERAFRPALGVHRVAVHDGYVHLIEDFIDVKADFLYQAGGVHSAGDGSPRIQRADHVGHPAHPRPPGWGIRGPRDEVGFVAQVPEAQPGMACQTGDDVSQEQFFRIHDHWVGERVAVAAVDDLTAADNLVDVCGHRLAREEHPTGNPVRTTHVAGEEGDVQSEAEFGGDVGDGLEIVEGLGVGGIRCRLKVFPEEEDADEGEAEITDDGKFFADFIGVKVFPPIHGFTPGPIVDAENEGIVGLEHKREVSFLDKIIHGSLPIPRVKF